MGWCAVRRVGVQYLYLELSVDLRRNVKDALIQYRSICQQTNVASLDKILRHYRSLAAQKTAAAEAQAASAGVKLAEEEQSGGAANTGAAIGGDDEEEESPESLLMLAMSGEGSKERSERQILLPWVRYQWESCRTILDVLRNNARLERLYHEVARSSFQYCLKFARKTEFRKLCEIMRTHLANIAKYQGQSTSVDLSNVRHAAAVPRDALPAARGRRHSSSCGRRHTAPSRTSTYDTCSQSHTPTMTITPVSACRALNPSLPVLCCAVLCVGGHAYEPRAV